MINKNTTKGNRIGEIDFARGLAIILMMIFHFIVDLRDFYGYNLEYLQGFWYIEGKLSAILFILLCGISSTLSQNSVRHGIIVLTWGMVLTVITYAYNANFYIRFGILHFLGISLLFTNLMRRLTTVWLILLTMLSIFIGLIFSGRFTDCPYLFPLGLQTNTFASLDFYPLFPWFGIFLIGMATGKRFYPHKKSLHSLHPPKVIAWLGQHSLAIYLVHQPILLALLYVIHRK